MAMMRDEADYVLEWVQFHLAAGVDRLLLYCDDVPDVCARIMSELRLYIQAGLVSVLNASKVCARNETLGLVPQFRCNRHAVLQYHNATCWFARLDLDEFLHPGRHGGFSEVLSALLTSTGNHEQILVPRIDFGDGGHEQRPRTPMVEATTARTSFRLRSHSCRCKLS
eukprot:TRINITY_DN27259_c0_g1_i2.p2 TRINITY_DN27259_c0_g1~~TRINITY_DN27259_c0_g1_i2.p2  ORF type:complete len:168 (-),score=28.28 TRINITY_DN27259_c0_g1_i2:87-590(-)